MQSTYVASTHTNISYVAQKRSLQPQLLRATPQPKNQRLNSRSLNPNPSRRYLFYGALNYGHHGLHHFAAKQQPIALWPYHHQRIQCRHAQQLSLYCTSRLFAVPSPPLQVAPCYVQHQLLHQPAILRFRQCLNARAHA